MVYGMTNQDDPGRGYTAALAATLQAERAAARMTLNELAAKADLNPKTLFRLLHAQRDINVEQLSALATAFDLRPSALLAEAERRMARTDSDANERTNRVGYLLQNPQQDEELVRRLGALESQMGVSGVGVQRLAAKIRHDRKAELTEMLHALAPDTGVDHTG